MTGFGFSPGGRAAKKRAAASAVAAFDPSTLSPSFWARANATEYDGSPWVVENGSNLAEATNPPAVGSTVNGFAPADFDGTNDLLKSSGDFEAYVSGSAGTVLVLFRADTAAAAAADKYDDPPLVCDDANCFNLGFSDGGIGVAYFDGAWVQPARIASATTAWTLAKVRWNGATLEYGRNSAAFSSAAAGALAVAATFKVTLGRVAISGTAFLDGQILEVFMKASVLTNQNITDYISYLNSRYGLSL